MQWIEALINVSAFAAFSASRIAGRKHLPNNGAQIMARGTASPAGNVVVRFPQPTEAPFVLGERTGGRILRFAGD